MVLRPVSFPPNFDDFSYPLEELCFGVDCDNIPHSEKVIYKDYDNLETPSRDDIKNMLHNFKFDEVFYFQVGTNDDETAWILFVRIDDLLIYFEALTCYTGFEYDGNFKIEYSKNIDNIWNNSICSEMVRNQILSN